MVLAVPRWLCWVILLGLVAGTCRAQTTSEPSGKKTPAVEDPAKTPKEKTPPRPTVDKMIIPPGAILVLVEELKEALAVVPSFVPKMVLLTPEKFQEMQERIQALERQLKGDKEIPHSCKLTGRVDGDFAYLQADFTFATRTARSGVLLGMQGAQLMDEGELDHHIPILEYSDGGLLVRVDNAGAHQLRLRLKVPVSFRRASLPGAGAERGFEVGLPGAAVTRLSLELPAAVREVRWNELVEKDRVLGRWEMALGTARNLQLSWKEPLPLPGVGPLPSVEGQITVKVEENHVLTTADLALQDLRGQTREWAMILPPEAHIEVKNPAGLMHEIVAADQKPATHILRLAEPSGERLQIQIQARQARPTAGNRLPIGPFAVVGAYRQQGTIVVQATPESLRGYRLLYHRFGEVFPREPVKSQGPGETLAAFQYWNLPQPGKAPPSKGSGRHPLELEFKVDRGLLTTNVEHLLRLRGVADGWQIDATTKIKIKALQDNVDSLDVFVPRLHPESVALPSIAVASAFPGAIPWIAFAVSTPPSTPLAIPLDFVRGEDSHVELVPGEGTKPARIRWQRTDTKELTITLLGRYFVPMGKQRARLELPRPLGTLDRGGKVTIQADEQWELLTLTPAGEEPVVEKHQQLTVWEQAPRHIDLAWRVYRPDVPAVSIVNINVYERDAHVRQQLTMQLPPRASGAGALAAQVSLQVPLGLKSVEVSGGGKLVTHDADKDIIWVGLTPEAAAGKESFYLDYDFVLPPRDGRRSAEKAKSNGASRTFKVPLLWPAQASRLDSKVRVWCDPGMVPVVAPTGQGEPPWHDRGTEIVPGRDSLPGLVLHALGKPQPLYLGLLEPPEPYLAGGVFDRGLFQVAIDDDGGQHCRARFLVRKLNSRYLDVELPVPVLTAIQSVLLGQKRLNHWFPLEPNWNVARIPVEPGLFAQPVVLDIEYKLPASLTEGGRFWQTTLYPPLFHNEFFLGRLRWQLSVPSAWVALPAGGQTVLDYQWGLQGWLLTPEAAVSSGDVEQWLLGKEAADSTWPVSQAFWRTSLAPLRLWHLPRQGWFLLCSGLFLLVSLGLVLVPLSRWAFWVLVAGVGLGLLGVGIFWPATLPLVLYGCQPGVVVLLAILGLQWLLQERYRRQVVFMPGFTRTKAGSSLIRGGSANPAREPSTIDAAPPAGVLAPPSSSAKGS